MQLITAPSPDKGMYPLSLFLAGGITKCTDWQAEIALRLSRFDITVFNPRRKITPKGYLDIVKQIEWEYYRLRRVTIVAFWFAPETLNPITLFELGATLARGHSEIIVGVSPKYKRRLDVIEQCKLQHQQVMTGFDQFTQEIKSKIETLL